MKCQRGEWIIFFGGGGREKRTFNAFKERSKGLMGSNVQNPENNVIYKNPNFYRELGCEVSGDAAREGANRAIEP